MSTIEAAMWFICVALLAFGIAHAHDRIDVLRQPDEPAPPHRDQPASELYERIVLNELIAQIRGAIISGTRRSGPYNALQEIAGFLDECEAAVENHDGAQTTRPHKHDWSVWCRRREAYLCACGAVSSFGLPAPLPEWSGEEIG